MSTLKVSEIQSNTTGAPPLIEDSAGVQVGTFCRAWANWNGTGTVAIRASFNVLGITDRGVGLYTVNLANALPDANYAAIGWNGSPTGDRKIFAIDETTPLYSTSQINVTTGDASADTAGDREILTIAIFR